MRVIYITALIAMTVLNAVRCQQVYGNYLLSNSAIVDYPVGQAFSWKQYPAHTRASYVLLQRPDYPGTGYVPAYVGQSLAYLKRKRA